MMREIVVLPGAKQTVDGPIAWVRSIGPIRSTSKIDLNEGALVLTIGLDGQHGDAIAPVGGKFDRMTLTGGITVQFGRPGDPFLAAIPLPSDSAGGGGAVWGNDASGTAPTEPPVLIGGLTSASGHVQPIRMDESGRVQVIPVASALGTGSPVLVAADAAGNQTAVGPDAVGVASTTSPIQIGGTTAGGGTAGTTVNGLAVDAVGRAHTLPIGFDAVGAAATVNPLGVAGVDADGKVQREVMGAAAYWNNSLSGLAVVSGGKSKIHTITVHNLSSAAFFVQIFLSTASPTLGSTFPDFEVAVPSIATAGQGAVVHLDFPAGLQGFAAAAGLHIAATTTSKGASAVGASVCHINLTYSSSS